MNEEAVLIGDRQLMEYTDRAKTTVRDWHQRPFNPIPFTLNDKGHKVFKIAEVDAWLSSRGETQGGYSETALLKQETIRLAEENEQLALQVSSLQNAKTAKPGRVEQFVQARETVRLLVRDYRIKFTGTTNADLAQADRFVVEFFNKVQAYLKLNTDTAQNNQVISE